MLLLFLAATKYIMLSNSVHSKQYIIIERPGNTNRSPGKKVIIYIDKRKILHSTGERPLSLSTYFTGRVPKMSPTRAFSRSLFQRESAEKGIHVA